jgi:1,4-dihydroxy-2-naphthoate octaprenyltransferase
VVAEWRISTGSFAVSIPVALWVAAILLINEVPDIRADAAAGSAPRRPAWSSATRRIYAGIQLAAIVTFLLCGAFGFIHWWIALPSLLLLPQAIGAARSMRRSETVQDSRAIETTLKLHLSGCFLLSAALVTRFVSN